MKDHGSRHLEAIFGIDDAFRDQPADDFAGRMETAYPTEREFEELLRRKLRRRALPRAQAVSLENLSECLQNFLEAHVEGDFTVSRQRWLSGGASKIQMAFTLEWEDEGTRTTTEMVIRMEPQESLNATSRKRELELINAFAGTVPVPRAFWVDDEGRWFPEPALVYEFSAGVTVPSNVEGRATGVGSKFTPELRASLGRQFVEHLAAIHTFDASSADLPSFDHPETGTTQSALAQLNRARRVWEEDRGEEFPILEVAANWLERNAPILDRVSVIHGDYRTGNFLFDEPTGRINVWLDWERGHLGDRHRDLAWITLLQFGNYDADGTFLVSGLIPLDEFYRQYTEVSGLNVDQKRLRYYRVLNSYQLVVSTLGSAYRVVRLGRSHQDVLLAWLEGAAYLIADEMRTALLEEN
ncbi:phosphotransferase [Rhodococcus sp. LB1]|nr:phosphotransferase [Rhodococcus sp. LB1]